MTERRVAAALGFFCWVVRMKCESISTLEVI